MPPEYAAWAIVALGMLCGFLNGVQDSGSLAAAMICSGTAGPRRALLVAALAQFAGALAVGVAVAYTIGRGIVDTRLITTPVVLAALIATILWNALTWYLGIPSSTSHALVGALAGAMWMQSGAAAISLSGLGAVLLVLLFAPWLGFLASFAAMRLLLLALRNATPRVGPAMRQLQWLLAPALAFGHGANDAQKVMGIVALGLLSTGELSSFTIPPWLQWVAALSLAAGTSVGGLRVMRTLGLRLYRIRPIHGFAAQAAAAAVILTSSILGGPVSTSQVMSASIAGAGSAQRFSQVRWGLIGNIITAWLLTIPATAGLAALACMLLVRV